MGVPRPLGVSVSNIHTHLFCILHIPYSTSSLILNNKHYIEYWAIVSFRNSKFAPGYVYRPNAWPVMLFCMVHFEVKERYIILIYLDLNGDVN